LNNAFYLNYSWISAISFIKSSPRNVTSDITYLGKWFLLSAVAVFGRAVAKKIKKEGKGKISIK
jgi:hypothetical protein